MLGTLVIDAHLNMTHQAPWSRHKLWCTQPNWFSALKAAPYSSNFVSFCVCLQLHFSAYLSRRNDHEPSSILLAVSNNTSRWIVQGIAPQKKLYFYQSKLLSAGLCHFTYWSGDTANVILLLICLICSKKYNLNQASFHLWKAAEWVVLAYFSGEHGPDFNHGS